MRRAGVLLVALGAAACRSPTQITFDVTTDLDCGVIQSTSLVAGPLAALSDDRPPTTIAPACATAGHIGSLVVLPSGGDGDLVAVKIVTGVDVPPDQCGAHGEGCIVAKRALRFEPHAPLTVKVAMNAACKGIECAAESTCVEGVCRSAIITDPTACEGAGCGDGVLGAADGGAPIVDAGPAIDATLLQDASSDASGDGSIDAASRDAGPPFGVTIALHVGCAIRPDHTVACWGDDYEGAVGNGYEGYDAEVPTPVVVQGLDHVAQIASGAQHACAVLDDGGVWCWGYVGNGATGTGDVADDVVPTRVTGLPAIGLISASKDETCAASRDGRSIWCWGNFYDESHGESRPTPVPSVDAGVVEMHGGWGVTCGRFDDGVVRCWGENVGDGLGQGTSLPTTATSTTPLAVAGLSNPTQLAMGESFVCVVDASHALWCWGTNDSEQLGQASVVGFTGTPTLIGVDPHVVKVACGDDFGCVLYDDAGTRCWGYDYEGELGVAPAPVGQNEYAAPIAVPNLGPAIDLVAGGQSACALLVDGGVMCWGNDAYDQLGAGVQPAMPIGALPVTF